MDDTDKKTQPPDLEPLVLPGETPEQWRARSRRAIKEASAKVSAISRAETQARIHAIRTGEIKPNRRFPQENNFDTARISFPTEEQIRAELSKLTHEDLEQIAYVSFQFRNDASPEMIRRLNLRRSIARELLGLTTPAQEDGQIPRF